VLFRSLEQVNENAETVRELLEKQSLFDFNETKTIE